jgi:hypothetical protein
VVEARHQAHVSIAVERGGVGGVRGERVGGEEAGHEVVQPRRQEEPAKREAAARLLVARLVAHTHSLGARLVASLASTRALVGGAAERRALRVVQRQLEVGDLHGKAQHKVA